MWHSSVLTVAMLRLNCTAYQRVRAIERNAFGVYVKPKVVGG